MAHVVIGRVTLGERGGLAVEGASAETLVSGFDGDRQAFQATSASDGRFVIVFEYANVESMTFRLFTSSGVLVDERAMGSPGDNQDTFNNLGDIAIPHEFGGLDLDRRSPATPPRPRVSGRVVDRGGECSLHCLQVLIEATTAAEPAWHVASATLPIAGTYTAEVQATAAGKLPSQSFSTVGLAIVTLPAPSAVRGVLAKNVPNSGEVGPGSTAVYAYWTDDGTHDVRLMAVSGTSYTEVSQVYGVSAKSAVLTRADGQPFQGGETYQVELRAASADHVSTWQRAVTAQLGLPDVVQITAAHGDDGAFELAWSPSAAAGATYSGVALLPGGSGSAARVQRRHLDAGLDVLRPGHRHRAHRSGPGERPGPGWHGDR